MVRGGARGGRGRGRGRGCGHNEVDAETASVTESTHNSGQAPASVHGVDSATLRKIVMDSVRQILEQGQFQIPPVGQGAGVQVVPEPMAAYNWRKQLERNFGTVRCPLG
ncbi:unnamed protein product [Arabis nemorensis]|uniref:Uncharacterized protein n=1 Tax=Arabis nemorensis TaxID=586526 RepID=A0A565BCC0_9BRAS|nr:unnamed protein product [Arabis nemorensis]